MDYHLFGTVRIPDAILDAQNTDKLLIFAGAGISKPSGIKSLLEIFKNEIKKHGIDENEGYEKITNLLEEKGIDIRNKIYNYLENGKFKPNSYHKNILKLFTKSENIKIITTNYDDLFQKAAKELKLPKLNFFTHRALPSYDNIDRLIQLHGSTLDTYNDLVISSKHFNNTYFSGGSLITFITEVFKHNHILYIGFSNNDIIWELLSNVHSDIDIKYRYALCSDKDTKFWNELHISKAKGNKGPKGPAFR